MYVWQAAHVTNTVSVTLIAYITTLILYLISSYRVATQQTLEPLIKMGKNLPVSMLMQSWNDYSELGHSNNY